MGSHSSRHEVVESSRGQARAPDTLPTFPGCCLKPWPWTKQHSGNLTLL